MDVSENILKPIAARQKQHGRHVRLVLTSNADADFVSAPKERS
jgi:hypothetical protein